MIGDNLSDRFLDFSARVLNVTNRLPRTFAGRHIAGQLIRCATSSGANYEEARGAESDADFVHKLRIVLKELRESTYWLKLIVQARLLPPEKMAELVEECQALARIVAKSLMTLNRRLKEQCEKNTDAGKLN